MTASAAAAPHETKPRWSAKQAANIQLGQHLGHLLFPVLTLDKKCAAMAFIDFLIYSFFTQLPKVTETAGYCSVKMVSASTGFCSSFVLTARIGRRFCGTD